MGVQIPFQSPVTNPNGTISRPYQGYLQALEKGVTGPVGPQGAQGIQGVQGVQGVRGTEWFSGVGVPGAFLGQLNGDWYLDLSTSNVWELAGGSWILQGNISPVGNTDGGQAATNFGGISPLSGGTA